MQRPPPDWSSIQIKTVRVQHVELVLVGSHGPSVHCNKMCLLLNQHCHNVPGMYKNCLLQLDSGSCVRLKVRREVCCCWFAPAPSLKGRGKWEWKNRVAPYNMSLRGKNDKDDTRGEERRGQDRRDAPTVMKCAEGCHSSTCKFVGAPWSMCLVRPKGTLCFT